MTEVENESPFSISQQLDFMIDDSAEGVAIASLSAINTPLSNLADSDLFADIEGCTSALKFVDKLALGFIKKNSFDEKIYIKDIVVLLNNLGKIVQQFTSEKADSNPVFFELICAILEFLQSFLTNYPLRLLAPDSNVESLKNFSKVEYYQSWRNTNQRECEKVSVYKEQDIENKSLNNSSNKLLKVSNYEAFEQSDIIEVLIDFLQKNNSDCEELGTLVLEIFRAISHNLPLTRRVCELNFLKDLLYIIYDNKEDFRSYKTKLAFEILWNALDLLEKDALDLIKTEDTLLICKELLFEIIRKGYMMEDKCLRNELMVLVNHLLDAPSIVEKLFEKPADTIFLSTLELDISKRDDEQHRLPELLLFLATVDERNKMKNGQEKRKLFDLTNEDIQFKKLVIIAVALIVKHAPRNMAVPLLEKSNFLACLFLYITPNDGDVVQLASYGKPQIKELQLEFLKALEILVQSESQFFIQQGGIELITRYILGLDDPIKIEPCLVILEKVSSQLDEKSKERQGELGLLDFLVDIANNHKYKNFEEHARVRMKGIVFQIISNICENCLTNQRLFCVKGGIEIILLQLKSLLIIKSERYVVANISLFQAIWTCVLSNQRNEDFFLENEGFYVLMEVLETCLPVHKKLIISVINCLLENKKSLRYFEHWTSSNSSMNSTQVLLKIYKEEDTKFKVVYLNGVLQSIDRPLNPRESSAETSQAQPTDSLEESFDDRAPNTSKTTQTIQTKTLQTENKAFAKLKQALKASKTKQNEVADFKNGSASIENILVKFVKRSFELIDLRRSIFAIFHRVGFDKNPITPQESQLMEIVQMYPQLMVGQVWMDTYENCKEKGIQLTFEDEQLIDTNIEEMKVVVNNCLRTQRIIARGLKKDKEDELQRFYDMVRSQKK